MKEETGMLELIFEAKEEELAIIEEQDKLFINQNDSNRSKKHYYLDKQLEKITYNLNWLKGNIKRALEDYIEAIDYEGAYFCKKYYLTGLKDGIKLKEELR